MAYSPETEADPTPLWEFVSIDEYKLPAAIVTQAVKKGLAILRPVFQRDESEKDSPAKSSGELQTLPVWELERIAPAPDWHGATEALNAGVGDWLAQEKPEPSVIFVVGPPYSGNTDALAAWAKQESIPTLEAPSPEQILAADPTWCSEQIDVDKTWVFPSLERSYLRHAAGLSLVRGFLEQAHSGQLGRGVIGCDSWAWAYLRRVWRGKPPVALTLQGFDQKRLANHFLQLSDVSRDKSLRFRESNSGHSVLPFEIPDTEEDSPDTSNFLELLAAHARGNPGVARKIWRASLRVEPDEELVEEAETEDRPIPHDSIWVSPWVELDKPRLPADAALGEAFVLHALLLHGGLPLELLQMLLPQSNSQVMETLFNLEEAGLVTKDETFWRVSARGYPAAREFLGTNGYLVDDF